MKAIKEYLQQIQKHLQAGSATEHSYRGHLEKLLNQLINDNNIIVTNEPKRIKDVGAPDYSISKNNITIGHIEAKDLGDSDLLGKKENKAQFDRYKKALPNLIITDYLRFHFHQNGTCKSTITLATIEDHTIIDNEQDFQLFINTINDFTNFVSQNISSALQLAKLMAGKARLLENVIEKAILSDEENEANNSLKNQLTVFKKNLIHDLTAQSFADIYAQTIAYGLFTARLHDNNLTTFSRQEAQNLIPKTNPFLRGLFNYIGGVDCDDRLIWIIDSLAEIFLYTNPAEILQAFYKKKGVDDPIIHFYETFLSAYNPKLRKSRGVWYTPNAVVNFIVRAVDELLKTEFQLNDGMLNDSKITIPIDDPHAGLTKNGKVRQKKITTHRVQILDPATGTGTFLAEAIKHMKENYFGVSWSNYVEKSLFPRLHGFELLMASYAMAHLKLDLLLMQTKYQSTDGKQQQRFNVFLTNSLEEYHQDTGTLFAQYLANESKQANKVKKETPVMVVMGNPPYSGESANKGDWIMKLMEDYKKEPEGKTKLQERNPKWINDDYVKFIRYGQYHIEKNGEGILAFINPHGFLDNPTFRGMRWHLLKTFDKIYTIDLHGNAKKKETAPDGTKDENVFDIQQGVSINLFIKNAPHNPPSQQGTPLERGSSDLAQVYHFDLYGKREDKYNFLSQNSLQDIPFTKIPNRPPMYFMVPKDFELETEYQKGFSLSDLFPLNSVGVVTAKDKVLIAENKDLLKKQVIDFYGIEFKDNFVRQIDYRPFDNKWIYYETKLVGRARKKIMQHFLKGENIGLSLCKQFKTGHQYVHTFISNNIIESSFVSNRTSEITSTFPLYLYPEESLYNQNRTPNLDPDIINKIAKKLKLTLVDEKQDDLSTFAPIDLLDYIYAVLHSPTYREKYREFLKIDFPRVPYPNGKTFHQLVALGSQIRKIHLLEDPNLDQRIITTQGDGNDKITNQLNRNDWLVKDHKVSLKINDQVSITDIPLIAWEFYIGGYQPAQKWLKDRIGNHLSSPDLKHYNRIINALVKTHQLMQKIDKIQLP